MKKILLLLFPACALLVLLLWGSDCAAEGLFRSGRGLLLALGRLAALAAAAAVLAQVLMISRAAWLEPLFGLDRLTRLHHVLGLAIPAALILHPALIVSHHAAASGLAFTAQYAEVLGWEDVPAASAGMVLALLAVAVSLPAVRRRLSYEAWHSSHLLFYAVLGLAAGHQFELGGNMRPGSLSAWTWYSMYAFSLANLVWGRVLRPLLLFRRHRFAVEKIIPETTGTESIWVSGRDMESFPAEAGQFALLRFWAPGFRSQAHPFSISRRPDGKSLRFTVKKLGDFTAAVHHSLRPGVPVIIDGPYGAFTEKLCLGDKALLIAGGIGITPLRALAERLQAESKDCVLIYANRAQKDVVFRRELRDMELAGGLKVFHVLSDEPDWPGEKGLLDAGRISRLVPDLAERDVFICGPEPMAASVSGALAGLGVSGSRIHREVFCL